MKRWVTALLLMPAVPLPAAEIAPELWDRPRSAQAVMAAPAVRQAVAAFQQDDKARIVIVHGMRPESQAQAEELRAWLVALAIDGRRVQLRADQAATAVGLEIIR